MKCGKVKNPCKICFQKVSNKNGLQCKGACKKWAHFKCLNYTPGKISDIKAGIIKVSCPCPDCTTSKPKEVLANPPFTCVNEECPATQRPVCESTECPSKDKPIPSFPPMVSTTAKPECPNKYVTPDLSAKCPTPPKISPCPRSPIKSPCSTPPKKSPCPTPPKKSPCSTPPNKSPCRTPPKKSPTRRQPKKSPPRTPPEKSPCPTPPRKASLNRLPSPPRRPDSPPLKITVIKQYCPTCPTHCPKRSENATLVELQSPQRSHSCSLNSEASNQTGKTKNKFPCSCSSDTALLTVKDQKMFCNAIEQMCDTVGQLSDQMKDLMCLITDNFQKKDKKNKKKC